MANDTQDAVQAANEKATSAQSETLKTVQVALALIQPQLAALLMEQAGNAATALAREPGKPYRLRLALGLVLGSQGVSCDVALSVGGPTKITGEGVLAQYGEPLPGLEDGR